MASKANAASDRLAGRLVTSLSVSVGEAEGLVGALSDMLPIVAVALRKRQSSDEEVRKFQQLQTKLLWYSGVYVYICPHIHIHNLFFAE